MITLQRTPTVPLGKVRLSLMMLLRNKRECDNDTYVINIKDIEHFANGSHNLVIIAKFDSDLALDKYFGQIITECVLVMFDVSCKCLASVA